MSDVRKKSSTKKHGLDAKKVTTTYIGGLGYYTLIFGWALLILILIMNASEFVLNDGVSVESSSEITTTKQQTAASSSLSWAAAISAPLVIAVSVMVIVFPYFLARYMKRFPRWFISNSGLLSDAKSILQIKISAASLLFLVTVLGIFGFYQDVSYNLPSFIIYGCTVASVMFFLIQHGLAKLWKLHYDDIQ